MDMDCIWCIIVPALWFLLGALLGYLLSKYLFSSKDNTAELDAWKLKYEKLEKDLADCRSKVAAGSDSATDLELLKKKNDALGADLAACRAQVSSLKLKSTTSAPSMAAGFAAGAVTNAIAFDGDAAKLAFGKKVQQDDLKVVEGIGPKIEGLFHSFDIKTWKALSETSVEKCQEVLDSGGERYKIHNPGSWPKQSKMAYEGQWDALQKWQSEHKGGKE